jgi:type IV secretion system protein VirD4
LVARIVTLMAALLVGLSVASEVFAYVAHLDAVLGAPWWRQGVLAFYPPWAILGWAWYWLWLVPQAFQLPGLVGSVVAGITLVKTWPQTTTPTKTQAKWASDQELTEAELVAKEGAGTVLGKLWKRIYRYAGVAHLLVVAGTQSGKTVSIVRPTILEWPGSMIINDPKGGLYHWLLPDKVTSRNTAGYRASLGKVVLLAPLQDDTDCFNLWETVPLGTDDEYRAVQLISMYLANPEGKVSQDEASQHFKDLVNLFMPGVFLYGLKTGIATTGAEFNDLVNGTEFRDLLTVMANYDDPIVQKAAMLAKKPGENEGGSLQTSLARALSLFNDPRIARMTGRSTFTLADLREHDKPCTVYLSVPFNDQERLRVLVVLFLRLMLDHCTSRLTGWKHQMLVMLEEFPSLGRCDFVSNGLDHAAEFGVQYCLVTPSMQKLVDKYGQHHNFLDGCRVQVVFGLSAEATAKTFSGRVGTHDEKRERVTRQKGGRQSISDDIREVPLLNATGLLKLGPRQVLVMAGPSQRVLTQARYYEHSLWDRRSQMPLPEREGVKHV